MARQFFSLAMPAAVSGMLCQMMIACAAAASSSRSASVSHKCRVSLAAPPITLFSMADSASPCGAVRQSMIAMWGRLMVQLKYSFSRRSTPMLVCGPWPG